MKKNMKRFLSLLLAGIMTTGCLTGCGQSGKEQESTQKSESKTVEQSASTSQTSEVSQEAAKHPITTEPITISILTSRQSGTTKDASELWCYKYLEWWMNQQGYNITLDVEQTFEPEQLSLMLATDNMPDVVMGFQLMPADLVKYGYGEGMFLDWTDLINEETMPNLCTVLETNPGALSVCQYEGVNYGLPYVNARGKGAPSASFSMNDRIFLNKEWMDELGIKDPTNIDEFLDMLRKFKEKELEGGEEVIPLAGGSGRGNFLERYLWSSLGFYGAELDSWGRKFAIKDDEFVLPAYTEEYRTFIEIMKTCYDEGLISQDYFTMDATTIGGIIKSGLCGVIADYSLEFADNFSDWYSMTPFPIGDNDEVVYSTNNTYDYVRIWASADFEYPEVLAYMFDYLYTPEGATYWRYGPMQGEDPLGLVDGWYYDDDGVLTTKQVADGTYANFTAYCRENIYAYDNVGCMLYPVPYSKELAGVKDDLGTYTFTDAITGEAITCNINKEYKDDNADGWWRITNEAASGSHMTTVRLASCVYLSEDDTIRSTDLQTVINEYIASESAKFVTGIRPIDEIDEFQKELKAMDVEEYIEIYKEAYSDYMDMIFK